MKTLNAWLTKLTWTYSIINWCITSSSSSSVIYFVTAKANQLVKAAQTKPLTNVQNTKRIFFFFDFWVKRYVRHITTGGKKREFFFSLTVYSIVVYMPCRSAYCYAHDPSGKNIICWISSSFAVLFCTNLRVGEEKRETETLRMQFLIGLLFNGLRRR